MKLFCYRNYFWIKWAFLGLIVFSIACLMPTKRKFHKLETENNVKYEPFKIQHFTVGIRPEDYNFLFSDRPISLYSWQPAEFVIDRKPVKYNARMRIRGTHAWNWDFRKPSFRLRIRGQKQALGKKTFDFINPDDPSMLANLVADNISNQIGLISPETSLVTVTLNGDYKGLYHLADSINHDYLVRRNKPENAVIEGNARNSTMWSNIELWEIDPDHATDKNPAKSALKGMLQSVSHPVTLSEAKNISNFLDLECMAKWSALMTAIASIHTNDFFGNIFIFDDKTAKLSPAISDSTGFGVLTSIAGTHSEDDAKVPINEFLTPVLNACLRHPEWQFKRNKIIFDLINDQLSASSLKKLTDKYLELLKPVFFREPYASALINAPLEIFPVKIPVSPETQCADAQRLLDFMQLRRNYIFEELNNLKVEIVDTGLFEKHDGLSYAKIVFKVSGHCPVSLNLSKFAGKVLPDFDFDNKLDTPASDFYSFQLFYPGLKKVKKEAPSWLMMEKRWAKYALEPDFQTYILGIHLEQKENILDYLRKNCFNAVTGTKIESVILTVEQNIETSDLINHNSLHPWRNIKK
jgi:hypothetical protein